MAAEVNYEALILFGRFGGAMLGLLLLVWLIGVLTPQAAKLIFYEHQKNFRGHRGSGCFLNGSIGDGPCRVKGS